MREKIAKNIIYKNQVIKDINLINLIKKLPIKLKILKIYLYFQKMN